MTKHSKMFKRMLAVLMTLAMVVTMLPVDTYAKTADNKTVLAFTSDAHNGGGSKSADRLSGWIDNVTSKKGTIDYMGFCGDVGNAGARESEYWTYVQAIMDVVNSKIGTGKAAYTTGNHEYWPGNFTQNKNDTTKAFTLNAEAKEGDNYRIYCLGSNSSSSSYADQYKSLERYLKSAEVKADDKPIIILTHFPLHYDNGRTTNSASNVIDVLNTAADAGEKIVFLWGHNHTNADKHYDQIFDAGDKINYSSSSSSAKEIKFYYAAAGCMSDSDYGSGSGSVKGKGLVITVDEDNMLDFAYYDKNGNTLGTYSESENGGNTGTDQPDKEDPTEPEVPSTGSIDIAPTRDTVATATASVKVGEALTINVSNPDGTTSIKTGTAKVTNTEFAAITSGAELEYGDTAGTGKVVVKGLKAGTTTVEIESKSDYGNVYKATITLTVTGEGVVEPDEPGTEAPTETLDVTPSKTGVTTRATVAVNGTLKIKVKNPSSSNTKTITTSVADDSIAKIQSGATLENVDKSGTGEVVVKGLKKGETTITITAPTSDPSVADGKYKATITLTVTGEGVVEPDEPGTEEPDQPVNPENPTITEEVDVKPSKTAGEATAEATIEVGGTLTINVTNPSSSNKTIATEVANDSVAEITEGASLDLSGGKTGEVVVKGLKAGTTTITVTVPSSYSGNYTATITLNVVGEGVVEPDEPGTEEPTETKTLAVTPDKTGNVKAEATVKIGGTLTITITNSSQNPAKKEFTTTVADTTVAEITSGASVEIAGGNKTGEVVVTGLKAGTTTVNIEAPTGTNGDNPYTATITLTVVGTEECNHNWSAATCTAPKKCAKCGATEGTAAGHSFATEFTVDKAATCTEDGSKSKHCANCDAKTDVTVIPASHSFAAEFTVDKAATCTEDGLKSRHCANCDEKTEVTAIPAEHSWDADFTVDKEATCKEEGAKSIHCKKCTEKKDVTVIEKTEHSFATEFTVDKAATCTEDGSMSKHCANCDEKTDVTVIPAAAGGHSFAAEFTVDKKATCTEVGFKSRHCANCDEKTDVTAIPMISSMALSYTKKNYTGSSIAAPTLTVTDEAGNVLEKGTDYTVSGLANKKNIGSYPVTITFKGDYTGTETVYFAIVPTAPTSASAYVTYYWSQTSGYDDVKFEWSKVKGASGYNVYYKKSTAGGYTYLTATTKTYARVANLADGVKYNFKVVPYYKSGNTKYTSLSSKTASVYTLKKLNTPTVSKSGTKVKVKWKNINGETGYQISKSTKKTGTNIVATYKTTSGTYKTISATKGKTYYYKVRAYKTIKGKKVYGPWSTVVKYKR